MKESGYNFPAKNPEEQETTEQNQDPVTWRQLGDLMKAPWRGGIQGRRGTPRPRIPRNRPRRRGVYSSWLQRLI